MTKPIERRSATVEFKVEQRHRNAPPTLVGYASVFNQIDGPAGMREMVAAGAFTNSLKRGDAVTALWNHDANYVIASTKNGSLKLTEDKHGLLAEMTPIDTPTIRDLVIKPIQDGLVNKMSFGFETVKDEYTTDKDGSLRVLRDLTLLDVSPVVFPWYAGTDISARGRRLTEFFLKNPKAMRQVDPGVIASIVRIDALVDALMAQLSIPDDDPDDIANNPAVSNVETPLDPNEPIEANAPYTDLNSQEAFERRMDANTGVFEAESRKRLLAATERLIKRN